MRISWFITTIAAVIAWATPGFAQQVGNLTSEQAMISRGGARITAGSTIGLGDRLLSNETGSGVIVFRDESTVRMGPNADLTIDEFVYNPDHRTGTVRLRQSNGIARIFGGQISKRGSVEIRTPHIVLGVRGGITDLNVQGGQTVATLRGGVMTCQVGGTKRKVTNPGISCASNGQSLTLGRMAGTGSQLVQPVDPGAPASASGRLDPAHCASGAGAGSDECRSRDGGLPGPEIRMGANGLGAPSGGCEAGYDPQQYYGSETAAVQVYRNGPACGESGQILD